MRRSMVRQAYDMVVSLKTKQRIGVPIPTNYVYSCESKSSCSLVR